MAYIADLWVGRPDSYNVVRTAYQYIICVTGIGIKPAGIHALIQDNWHMADQSGEHIIWRAREKAKAFDHGPIDERAVPKTC